MWGRALTPSPLAGRVPSGHRRAGRGGRLSPSSGPPGLEQGEDKDEASSCIFMLWPRLSAAQSQLTGAGRLLWGGPTPPASRHSAIVQNGIGPRKLGACENRYEFCKTALRR